MNKSDIQYYLVAESISFYKKQGYRYIEAPWVVPPESINITRPKDKEKATQKQMVTSGEQSVLNMKLNRQIGDGSYICATPCCPLPNTSRNKEHFSQIFEVILCFLSGYRKPSETEYDTIIKMAFSFMSKYRTDIKIVKTESDCCNDCDTLISHDIRFIDETVVGTYGVRHNEKIGHWVYGTGISLPQFKPEELSI